MKSKTLIEKQIQKKRNSELVQTIIAAKKQKNWIEVASILSRPRKQTKNINLGELDKEAKEGEKIIVLGKVLSQGEITKKIDISALKFSQKAKEKLLKSQSKISTILEEIKKNPEAKGIKILK